MRDTILAFSKGNIKTEYIKLTAEPSIISIQSEPGAIKTGSFKISFDAERRIKTYIYSTNRRMKVDVQELIAQEAVINYEFLAAGLLEGTIVQGDFIILSEAGEYKIPYTITVLTNTINTSQGRLRSIEMFSAYAANNPESAYEAFCNPSFLNTIKNDDPRFTTLYSSLTKDGFSENVMNEFLSISGSHSLRTAGNTDTVITKNRKIKTINQEKALEMDRLACLYQLFLDFRCMKTSARAWIIKTRALLVEQMGMKNDSGFYSLYYVHTLIIEKKIPEAQKRLEEILTTRPQLNQIPDLYSYYMYLSSLINMSETYVNLCCERIWKIYKKHNTQPAILWILFMMERDFLKNPSMKCEMAEGLFERGKSSPLILMEIAMLYRRNPSLCSELSAFNTQVLLFAARKQMMTEELRKKIFELAARSSCFGPKIYLLLVKCHEEKPDKDSLRTICHYLIKNNMSDRVYFKWFEAGVSMDLRIARLYDYYLYSVKDDMDSPLPDKVLQYFKFNMELEYNKKSFIFANIYRFRQETGVYDEYKEDMKNFVVSQLNQGHINTHLAYLYSKLVDETSVNSENAYTIMNLLFSYHASHLPSWATAVIVSDPSFVSETVFPVYNGEAVVYLYSQESCILLKDRDRKRFKKDAGDWEKWFYSEQLMSVCESFCPRHPGLIIKKCERLMNSEITDYGSMLTEILSNADLTNYCKNSLLHKLLADAYNKSDQKNLELIFQIRQLYPLYLRTDENLLKCLLSTGRYEEAFEYASKYGIENEQAGQLVIMCDTIIQNLDNDYNEDLYKLIKEVFYSGKFSESMIEYLIRYVDGEKEFLIRLLNAGRSFCMNVSEIEELIIIQSLFSKQISDKVYETYDEYDRSGGKAVVKNAFLSYISHEVITEGRIIDARFVDRINKRIQQGQNITKSCKIVWLKAVSMGYSGDESVQEEILDEFEQDDCIFDFYKNLSKRLKNKYFITDKIIIECHFESEAEVYCYYSLVGNSRFVRKRMQEVYTGIYTTAIPVFAKDQLSYYVSRETRDSTGIEESDVITIPKFKDVPSSRYERIDELLSESSYDKKDSQAIDYLREEVLNSKLFSLN